MNRTACLVILLSLTACGGRVRRDDGSAAATAEATASASAALVCDSDSELVFAAPGGGLQWMGLDASNIYVKQVVFDASGAWTKHVLRAPRGAGGPLTLLHQGTDYVHVEPIGMDDRAVYALSTEPEGDSVISIAKTDGATSTLVGPRDPGDGLSGCFADGSIYYDSYYAGSDVFRRMLADGATTRFAGDAVGVRLADDTDLFGIVGVGGTVQQLRKTSRAGGAMTVLATLDDTGDLLGQDRDALYLTQDGAIKRFPKAGGAPSVVTVLPDDDRPFFGVVEDGHVFWLHDSKDGSGTRELMSVPTLGGPAERLAVLASYAYFLVKAGDTFYYTTNLTDSGAVMRLTCRRT